jgi:hypothetical protein
LTIEPSSESGPTVKLLVHNIECQLRKEYIAHADKQTHDDHPDVYNRWHKLKDYNFIASADLTLTVTHSENFDPSLSFITPLKALGGVINPLTNAAQGTYSRSANVGVQLDQYQDRNFDVQFVVDMSRLVSDINSPADATTVGMGRPTGPCQAEIDDQGEHPGFSGLKGDLLLGEIIEDGITGIDASSANNVYGQAGPTNDADTGLGNPQNQGAAGTEGGQASALAVKPPAGGKTASASSTSTASGAVTFSSKIDFSIVEGLNGGPEWTLVDFKGPAAGGSTPLLNLMRTALDTLTITFTPTCKIYTTTPLSISGTVGLSKDAKTMSIPIGDMKLTDGRIVKGAQLLINQFDFSTDGPVSSSASGVLVQGQVDRSAAEGGPIQVQPASVQFTGYVRHTDTSSATVQIRLFGAITNILNQQPIGLMSIGGTFDPTKSSVSVNPNSNPALTGTITREALDLLMPDTATKDYWSTIPGCNVYSAGPTLDTARSQNMLLQFPADVRRLFQQQ